MIFRASVAGVAVLAAGFLSGCANETDAKSAVEKPAYLGAGIFVMGGARSGEQNVVIEPTSSSKVLSAIVFERVTGRTAYPDGAAFNK